MTRYNSTLVNGAWTNVPYTPAEEAAADLLKQADDLAQAPIIAEQQRRDGLAASADYTDLLNRAKTASSAQIDTWLTANVTNLAQARVVLGAIIKLIAVRLP